MPKQYPEQSGPGTKFKPTKGPSPDKPDSFGSAGNSSSGTSQSEKRGKQG